MTKSAIDELIELHSIADLDKLFLSEREGEKAILFGFSVCLFYEGGSIVRRRLDGNRVMADYKEIFRDYVKYFYPKGGRHRRKIDKIDPVDYYNKDAEKTSEIETYAAGLYEDRGIVRPHYIANVCRDKFNIWSRIIAYAPASWARKNDAGVVLETTLRWCDLLKPGHGTAGLSMILDEGSAKAPQSRLAFPLIKRFPGIDFPDLGAWSSEVRHEKKRWIRTVNWLTILDDKFVEELGGLAKMKAELGDECPVHVWDGGVIIQAGLEPEVGDVNQGLVPEAYRKVARLTKPLRFESLKGRISLLNPPPPLDHIDESLKWIRRFD